MHEAFFSFFFHVANFEILPGDEGSFWLNPFLLGKDILSVATGPRGGDGKLYAK